MGQVGVKLQLDSSRLKPNNFIYFKHVVDAEQYQAEPTAVSARQELAEFWWSSHNRSPCLDKRSDMDRMAVEFGVYVREKRLLFNECAHNQSATCTESLGLLLQAVSLG